MGWAREFKVIITIVCACGQHNIIPDERLETAICSSCGTPLLRPAPLPSRAVRPKSETLTVDRRAS
jgi:hypothetical protein